VIHVIELQRGRWSSLGSLWINLGVHLAFVPVLLARPLAKLDEPSCALRCRLSDEAGNEVAIRLGADVAASATAAWREVRERGLPLLERFACFPEDFVTLEPEAIGWHATGLSAGGRAALFLARCRLHAGDSAGAMRLAENELRQTAGSRAVAYLEELRRFAEQCGAR